MKYRKFNSLDISISEIGFGTWAIGGGSYGPVDDYEFIRALEYAYDKSINFFDTSDMYGEGHSESLLGKTFHKKRDKIIIATKVGYTKYKERIQDFSNKHILESIENSLKRLKTDYIDIYFLHSPPKNVLYSGLAYEFLNKLKKDGKIRFCGVSVRTADDGLLALKEFDFNTIQVTYNLLEQQPKYNGLIKVSRENNAILVAKAPLSYGFLTGKYNKNTKFGNNDHRRRFDKKKLVRWIKNSVKFSFLWENGKRTMVQSALRFCLDDSSETIPIPGMKTVEQVKENIDAISAPPITEEESYRINQIYSEIVSTE